MKGKLKAVGFDGKVKRVSGGEGRAKFVASLFQIAA
jgi:hypothetical protein